MLVFGKAYLIRQSATRHGTNFLGFSIARWWSLELGGRCLFAGDKLKQRGRTPFRRLDAPLDRRHDFSRILDPLAVPADRESRHKATVVAGLLWMDRCGRIVIDEVGLCLYDE